jgi:hypothetical protein
LLTDEQIIIFYSANFPKEKQEKSNGNSGIGRTIDK